MHQPELELPAVDSPRPTKRAAALWSMAIHEAGHAVVAVYYGIPILEACVESAGKGWVQLDQEKIEPFLYTPACVRQLSQQVVLGYAGFIAILKLNPNVAIRWRGGVDDWKLNKDWLWWLWDNSLGERSRNRNNASHQPLAEAQVEQILARQARRLLLISRRLVHGLFPVIQVVARALIERHRLTGDEVVALAGPLIAKERAGLTAWPAAGHSDYVFRVHSHAQRMPRPKSFKRLGLKTRRQPRSAADCG